MPPLKKRKPAGARRGASSVARPARKSPRAHLLVIECDSTNLASQGLHLGTAFGQVVTQCFPNKRIVVVQTSSEDKLREDLATVFQQYGRFRAILVVGHSNPTALALTSEEPRSWSVVANWLRIFEPEFLFLAACEAGRSEAVRDLFVGIPSLRQIYASPVTLYKIHTAHLGVLVWMLLERGRLNPDQAQALRIVHYIVAGGQLFRWLRKDAGPGQELTGRLWDAVGTALNLGPWDLLEQLWPTKA